MTLANRIKKNSWLYFIAKLMLLVVIVFLLDFSIGHMLRYFYFKQECGRQYRATYAIEKTTADVLVFGSSRAYFHYVPDVIENKLNLTCYNTGSPGQFLLYNYATLKAILKRYSPKVIILDITPAELRVERDSYDRLAFLLPFYNKHEEIRSIVNLRSPLERFKLLSSIYAFNSSCLMIAGGNTEYFKKIAGDTKGYKPLPKVWDQPIESKKSVPYKIDSLKIDFYKAFIDACHRSGTKLFVVCSPLYEIYDKTEWTISIVEEIAKKKDTRFINFTNDTTFTNHADIFADPYHLNAKGSELFTKILMDKIKADINVPLINK